MKISIIPVFTLSLATCMLSTALAADPAPGQAASGALAQLQADAKSSGDTQLQSLSSELSGKVQSLETSLGNNTAAKSKVASAVESLQGGKSTDSLSALQKLGEAKLTPEQMNLAKQVRDVGSAYLVQKNFASLEGSQSEVAQIVTSLRKGQPATALPAMKKVAENAKLTQPQKDFLSSLTEKYTHGLGKAEETLKKLPSVPGLGQ